MGNLNSLYALKAQRIGLHGDGDGLYLQISKKGHKSWIFRYMINKRSRAMGLGSVDIVSLSEARIKAIECRKLLLEGIDPIEEKKSSRLAQSLLNSKIITFHECAIKYIEAHRPGWKNAKHADQWTNTIATYAQPTIGHLSIQDINTALIMRVLEPIWYKKAETASRLRNRIELIISWATVHGYRTGENPARWRGHLDKLLPKRSSVQQVKHFTALPVNEVGSFMEKLRALKGITPLGLEFQILTACRTGEVMGAQWHEIDFNEALWTIPALRMKAKREHRVPLSNRALEILHLLKNSTESDFIFPGRYNKQLSNNAFLSLIKKQIKINITAHGFRSTFSDWASEKTGHSREVIEMSLAHTIRDATEAAYRRGDLLLKRRSLMNDWGKFCAISSPETTKIVEMRFSEMNTQVFL